MPFPSVLLRSFLCKYIHKYLIKVELTVFLFIGESSESSRWTEEDMEKAKKGRQLI
jgi:hypothetical protein